MGRRRAERPPGDYEVGYGKPQEHTRWPKGHCPNPRGRPRRANTVAAILDRLLDAKVTIRSNGTTREVTRLEVLLMRAIDKAGKGDLPSCKFLIEMRQRFPTLMPDMNEPKEIGADDHRIIEEYLKRRPFDGGDEP